jgi:hypothetical protein
MALLQKAYLGATPLFRDEAWFEGNRPPRIVLRTANASLVTLAASATPHTKGSWSQLVASTSANASVIGFRVSGVNTAATNTATLLDIGTGASGSESVILSNIAVGGNANPSYFVAPFKIASGTRLAARVQSAVGSKSVGLITFLFDGGDYATAPTSVDVIGASTANSQGTSFSGASGTWVEGVASTSQAYRGVVLVLSAHDSDTANLVNANFEIGVGASGSEVAFGDINHTFNNSEQSISELPFHSLFGRKIPAASRLAVKHPIAADPGKYGFTLIGIP